jgi:hypothetical protein
VHHKLSHKRHFSARTAAFERQPNLGPFRTTQPLNAFVERKVVRRLTVDPLDAIVSLDPCAGGRSAVDNPHNHHTLRGRSKHGADPHKLARGPRIIFGAQRNILS